MTLLRRLATLFACAAGCLGANAAPLGAEVFRAHCARCHGDAADGNSRLAQVLTTKPADLRASRLPRAEQERVVRLGGEATGRAALMPAWQGQLNEAEISAVLDFLASVRKTPSSATPAELAAATR